MIVFNCVNVTGLQYLGIGMVRCFLKSYVTCSTKKFGSAGQSIETILFYQSTTDWVKTKSAVALK